MILYPKIDTLYRRLNNFNVNVFNFTRKEFSIISEWTLTEKIDGTNIRIGLNPDGTIELGGKTDNAQIPASLVTFFNELDKDAIHNAFKQDEEGNYPNVTIFGEGYGPKIQNGGKYRDDASIIVFDVVVDGIWWLSRDNVHDVACKIGLDSVPMIYNNIMWYPRSESDLHDIIDNSIVAYWNNKDPIRPEGIVARPDPMVYYADGRPIMWKLKFSDFNKGSK